MVQRIGLVGCGVISGIYLHNAPLFRDIEFTACADMRPEAAKVRADEYGIRPLTLDELYRSDEVDIVLNLTNPDAHAEVALKALEHGKHVYGEKPLATSLEDGKAIVDLAASKQLRVGSAPDTVLGPGVQTCRRLMDDGTVGEVFSGVATIMSRGMEHWHPAPTFYFRAGGGPVLDMGPYYIGALVTLLGPVAKVVSAGRIGIKERVVTADGPNVGQRITPEVPTTIHSILTFRSGAQVTLLASWDVWSHSHLPIELHGEKASLRVPDPNFMDGRTEIATDRENWNKVDTGDSLYTKLNYPFASPRYANYRGLGLADMAAGILSGRPHRANGEWAFHTLDVMLSILRSAEEERAVVVESSCPIPEALSIEEANSLLA
ncbi:Gfo/Idh/MocA family protein [Aureimonas leprariae]|uniref:Gfo/Idh/MocA family oxidoreductase n=1 Tax=Plantimonas leprariae TaxID=2615207 RepID=A0A7V7PN17_9HYPH|nr:Gfo/Idh/MocA family oxidoreductase [Aureimonas leprariae]KAB0678813.1 Gfo/Idh/MocA family oxidoreductase [Aureimonas leprariae]